MIHVAPPGDLIIEMDRSVFASIDHALKVLLAVGLAVAVGAPLGLLIQVRGTVFQRAGGPRALAVAWRTHPPEVRVVALVPETAVDREMAGEFKVYADMLVSGPDVRIFSSIHDDRLRTDRLPRSA